MTENFAIIVFLSLNGAALYWNIYLYHGNTITSGVRIVIDTNTIGRKVEHGGGLKSTFEYYKLDFSSSALCHNVHYHNVQYIYLLRPLNQVNLW